MAEAETPPYDIVIAAGYTPLPERIRENEERTLQDAYAERSLIGTDKALREYEGKPLIYYVLDAAFQAKNASSVTVVGSEQLEQRIGNLMETLKSEHGQNAGASQKPFEFRRHHTPNHEEENEALKGPTRMRLEEICMSKNLKAGRDAFGHESFKVSLPCELPWLRGELIDKAFEQCAPHDKRIYYPLIAKETLGRLRRNYLSVVDDKWGSQIHHRDQYGRIKMKESNMLAYAGNLADETLDFIASLYSLRKLNDTRSALRAAEVIAPDAWGSNVPGLNRITRKLHGTMRTLDIAYCYITARLTVSDTENLIERVSGEPFAFFQMQWPEFSYDIDTEEDLQRKNELSKESLKAEFSEVCSNPEAYMHKNLLLTGTVNGLTYSSSPVITSGGRINDALLSAVGYKEIDFELRDDGNSLSCFRGKNLNPLKNLLQKVSHRLYIKDSDSELLDSVEKHIDEVVTLPQMKYERLAHELHRAQENQEEVYVSGRLTPHGLWLHEIVTGDKRYYFRHHCADRRCSME